jgi:hypothetical protein
VKRILAIVALVVAATALAGCIPDGTYIVGPGCRYCAPQFLGMYWSPGGDGCYYARLRDSSGDVQSVIASTFRRRQGVQIVMIPSTDANFQTHGCLDWKPITGPLTPDPATPKPSEWDYRVNVDIAPGTWVANPGTNTACSWARLSGFGKRPGEIIQSGYASVQQTVHIASTDAGFTSSGCAGWLRTGD